MRRQWAAASSAGKGRRSGAGRKLAGRQPPRARTESRRSLQRHRIFLSGVSDGRRHNRGRHQRFRRTLVAGYPRGIRCGARRRALATKPRSGRENTSNRQRSELGFDSTHASGREISAETRTFARMIASLTERSGGDPDGTSNEWRIRASPSGKAIMATAGGRVHSNSGMDRRFLTGERRTGDPRCRQSSSPRRHRRGAVKRTRRRRTCSSGLQPDDVEREAGGAAAARRGMRGVPG